METTIKENLAGFNRFFQRLQQDIKGFVERQIEVQLEKEVSERLLRAYHERREQVKRRSSGARCRRCGSQQAKDFSRNGHRQRQLVSGYGVLNFWLPRVVCECGGSVQIPFSMLEPYQRFWDDLLGQVEQWADWGLSLRQMQQAIGEAVNTPVGLRKLNEVVQEVATPPALEFTSVPPVIMLDAIWVDVLQQTDILQTDTLGRQRVLKTHLKACVLVALGLYPQSKRWGILGWEVANSESQAAWERLLLPLEARGLYRERGVELFIHDGGQGLMAALDLLYPHIPHQRCLFHKLRNLWNAIQTPPGFSRIDARQFKLDFFHTCLPIFYAATPTLAQQSCRDFCQVWQAAQPKFVATLQRDWEQSIAFFQVLARFPNWQLTALRTTSLLERLNRSLRRLFRAATLFHSCTGLSAAVARVLNPKRLI